MVELKSVSPEVNSAGDSTSESGGMRVRNGTLNSYPVAKMTESTEDRELPSVNTIDEALK